MSIIAILWLDEWLDLPHLFFHTVKTPFNWSESTMETFILALLAALVLLLSHRMLRRIACLEGIIRICPICKRIRDAEHWIPFELFIERDSCAHFLRELCPECEQNTHHLDGMVRKELAKSLHP